MIRNIRFLANIFGCLIFALTATFNATNAFAVEGGGGFYLLGSNTSQAAVLPPPGVFILFDEYLYSGEVSSSTPIAEIGKIDLGVEADVALSLLTGVWAPAAKFLGGRPMLTLTLPFGYQKVSIDTELSIAGIKLRDNFSEDVFTYGDPVVGLTLGWNEANWHWTLSGRLNVPIGDYDKNSAANFGFNRWGFDTTGAVTYFDPKLGWEISFAAGITLNGENRDIDYKSGTELHLEAGVTKTFENGLAIGVAGYHYNQLTKDKGAAAPDSGFKGEVSAIGPTVSYTLSVKNIPIGLKVRWYHEFDAENRTEGDAVFISFSMPLAVY